MAHPIWTNFAFVISLIWINVAILIFLFILHSYQICYLQNDDNIINSSIKLCKLISIKHISFIVLISAFLAQIQQAITYTPAITSISFINDNVCQFTGIFGTVCISTSHLALHLFVSMRSQIVQEGVTSIWYKIGLLMISSDILFILYVISGIPTFISIQDGLLCRAQTTSPSIFIWFGINDFLIGFYCLIAFLLPLRKYVYLEDEMEASTPSIISTSDTKRIIFYSSTALISTILITVAAATIHGSGGRLMGIDSVINAICIVFQFPGAAQNICCKTNCFRWNQSGKNLVKTMETNTVNSKNDMHDACRNDVEIEMEDGVQVQDCRL